MGVSISTEGTDDIRNLIDRLEFDAENEREIMNWVLTAAAMPIYEEAKKTTAFIDRTGKPGKLRKSIKIGKVVKKKAGFYTIKVYSNERYAHLVEYGHSGPAPADAHPFLEPAFNHHKAEAAEIIANKLREAFR
jgi:HK97 gp10 family phage protein